MKHHIRLDASRHRARFLWRRLRLHGGLLEKICDYSFAFHKKLHLSIHSQGRAYPMLLQRRGSGQGSEASDMFHHLEICEAGSAVKYRSETAALRKISSTLGPPAAHGHSPLSKRRIEMSLGPIVYFENFEITATSLIRFCVLYP